MVDFENVSGSRMTDRPFFQALEKEENCDEDYEGCFHQPGKKRRLTSEQVQFLERNFEVENKLEPERKVQLAKELGLQPRQVAIWFQNRRARFKTKQLEKDYGVLKASYDRLKSDYESLVQENDKLKAEVKRIFFKKKRHTQHTHTYTLNFAFVLYATSTTCFNKVQFLFICPTNGLMIGLAQNFVTNR